MRRPGYAESSDFAAHQARQWSRAVTLWLGLAVLAGALIGSAIFVARLGPARPALGSFFVASTASAVAPEKVDEYVFEQGARRRLTAREARLEYTAGVFGGRSAGFLARQWALQVGLWSVASLGLLGVALRRYREHVFCNQQRRGAVLRDLAAETLRARRRRLSGFVFAALLATTSLGLISLWGRGQGVAVLGDYAVAAAASSSSSAAAWLSPTWGPDRAWFTALGEPGFRPVADVYAHLRADVFGGRAFVELLGLAVLVTSWLVLLFVALDGVRQGRKGRATDAPPGYRVAGVELPPGKECYHVLCCGSPGAGKSTAIKELLDQIRARRDRAIVYDLSGEYVELYFREGVDRLLNPADARSAYWTPWAEGDTPSSYAALAQSLFPPGGRDPFWARAAGALFAATLEKLAERGGTTNVELDEVLTLDSIEELAAVLQDTRAARYFDENAAAMQASVIATVATGLQGWRLLADQERHLDDAPPEPFSIRGFVEGEGEAEDSWLFLSTSESDATAMRPLLSLWADIASTALLSLPQTNRAKVWAILDEVASLQRLPALPGLLERGRKHGAAVVLGLQAMPQLREAYGRDQAAALAAQPQTWLVLRSVEPDTAKWLESALGMVESEEARTSLSMGASALKDGTSYQQHIAQRPLVLASEITTLPDFEGFLKMPGSPDVFRVRYAHKTRPMVASPFQALAGRTGR